jgi:hypothetical protein
MANAKVRNAESLPPLPIYAFMECSLGIQLLLGKRSFLWEPVISVHVLRKF